MISFDPPFSYLLDCDFLPLFLVRIGVISFWGLKSTSSGVISLLVDSWRGDISSRRGYLSSLDWEKSVPVDSSGLIN